MVGNPGQTDQRTDTRSPFLCPLLTSTAGTKSSGNSIFGQIFCHQRAEIEVHGKKVTGKKVTGKKVTVSGRKKSNRKESNSGQVGKKETGKKVTVDKCEKKKQEKR